MHTSFSRLSADVFGNSKHDGLTADEELSLIEATKHGDSTAFERLARGYAPGLRGQLEGYNSLSPEDRAEAQQNALVHFWEMVVSHTGDKRLSYTLKDIKRALNAERIVDTQTVSERTMYRYLALRTEYDGDLGQMCAHAREQEISADTVRSIHALRTACGLYGDEGLRYDVAAPDFSPEGNADELVGIAFAAISSDQTATEVMYLKYGFNDRDNTTRVSNDAIGNELKLGRKKVGKIISDSLTTMRESLGVVEYV